MKPKDDCADCGKPIKGEPIYFMGTSARCQKCHDKRMRDDPPCWACEFEIKNGYPSGQDHACDPDVQRLERERKLKSKSKSPVR